MFSSISSLPPILLICHTNTRRKWSKKYLHNSYSFFSTFYLFLSTSMSYLIRPADSTTISKWLYCDLLTVSLFCHLSSRQVTNRTRSLVASLAMFKNSYKPNEHISLHPLQRELIPIEIMISETKQQNSSLLETTTERMSLECNLRLFNCLTPCQSPPDCVSII